MPLPTNGAISFNDIRTEFGSSSAISMSNLYRNMGIVTNNNINVPTTGTISINNFYFNSTTGNGVRAVETAVHPYRSNASSVGYAYYNGIVYKLNGNLWYILSNNTAFSPCAGGWNTDFNSLTCSRQITVANGWQNKVSDCGGTYDVPVDGYYHRGYFRFSMHDGYAGYLTDMHSHQGCPSTGTGWLQGVYPYGPGSQIHGTSHNCTCPAWNASIQLFTTATEYVAFTNT